MKGVSNVVFVVIALLAVSCKSDVLEDRLKDSWVAVSPSYMKVSFGSKRNEGSTHGLNDGDDKIDEQDGVAAQCALPGLIAVSDDDPNKYGRSFIPSQRVLDGDHEIKFKKNILNSHFEDKFGWIFKIRFGKDGFVLPK